jgi:uncharacterized damage-inducible protein DinB
MRELLSKTQLLAELRAARAEWDALLAEIPRERMEQSGVEGKWSVKDIIAHVTWSEREMVSVLQKRALVGADPRSDELWRLSNDERNAVVVAQHRQRTLDDVLQDAQRTYEALLAAIQSLSDEDLNDARRFKDMPADWQPWRVLAGNSYIHYPDHARSIRAWLQRGTADEASA